jgi:DNA-binding transcriptional MerR regulator
MSPKARIQKRLYYKIGEACKALDIQPYVLRYWETEFPAISPSKSRSGQRVYSERELDIIRRIKQLLYDEGYTIAGAKKKLETELASGTLSSAPHDREHGDEPAVASEPPEPEPLKPPRRSASAPTPPILPAPSIPLAPPEPAAEEPHQVPLALGGEPGAQLDTRGDERIQRLRSGVERALAEAREILARLSS